MRTLVPGAGGRHRHALLIPVAIATLILALTPAPGRSDALAVPTPPDGRLIVRLTTAPTDAMLAELATLGEVHGWINRFRIVALTPAPANRAALVALPYVASVQADDDQELFSVGSWNTDIIDVADVEESGAVGDPDRREVAETGRGVHIAIIDSGLGRGWRQVLGEDKVDTDLARSFAVGTQLADGRTVGPEFPQPLPGRTWENDLCLHGSAVAAPITGMTIGDIRVEGVAPGARLIPLDVIGNGCLAFWAGGHRPRWGLSLSRILAAFDYLIGLKEQGIIGPTVLSLSVGMSAGPLTETAIGAAITAGIVVVAAAGNSGERGMGSPGSYPQVISVGAISWTQQYRPGTPSAPNLNFWWSRDVGFDPDPAGGADESSEAYVSLFSSRAIPSLGQELDVLAPGDNLMLPYLVPPAPFFDFAGGTSFSTPIVAGVAALILEKNPSLHQAQVENILKATALHMDPVDARDGVLFPAFSVLGPFEGSIAWDDDCAGVSCDPVGAGIVQADAALAATPVP